MSTPLLRAIDLHHPNVLRDPRCLPLLPVEPGLRAFLVVGEGVHEGVDYSVGDVLVCRGPVRDGQATVLVARHGRPRLGSVVGQRLLGDAGEPCHPGRWRPVGGLWALYRPSATNPGHWAVRSLQGAVGAVSELGSESVAVQPAPQSPRVGRVVVRSRERRLPGQLALFAA